MVAGGELRPRCAAGPASARRRRSAAAKIVDVTLTLKLLATAPLAAQLVAFLADLLFMLQPTMLLKLLFLLLLALLLVLRDLLQFS